MNTKFLHDLCRNLCTATLELIEETPDIIALSFELKEDNRLELRGSNTALNLKNFQDHLEQEMDKIP